MATERKKRVSKYGEKTVVVRVPESMLSAVQEMLKKREILETQWQDKAIGKDAQRIVDLIVDGVLATQRGLIKAYQESGIKSLMDEAEKMSAELESDRSRLRKQTVGSFIEVLRDDG